MTMSVIGEVLASLESMTHWQLLAAFVGCIAYAFAQGGLLMPRGRRLASVAAAGAAVAFVLLSRDWMLATMLLVFAFAALGAFVAAVWLTCRAIGFGRIAGHDAAEWPSTSPAPLASSSRRHAAHGEPAHSHF
jgi:hypothetical protein